MGILVFQQIYTMFYKAREVLLDMLCPYIVSTFPNDSSYPISVDHPQNLCQITSFLDGLRIWHAEG